MFGKNTPLTKSGRKNVAYHNRWPRGVSRARGALRRLQEHSTVGSVAASGHRAVLGGGRNGTVGLGEVGAIGEAALLSELGDLAKCGPERARLDRPDAEFVDARAIDKKAAAEAVEPAGGGRLASEPIARDLADRCVAAQRPKDGALADARVPDQHRAPARDEFP